MVSSSAPCFRPLGRVCLLPVLAAILIIAVPTFGQDGGSPTYHPFAFGFSGGDSATPDTKVYDVRIPMGFTLIAPTDDKWGLRLRLIAYAGVYNFNVEEAIGLDSGSKPWR